MKKTTILLNNIILFVLSVILVFLRIEHTSFIELLMEGFGFYIGLGTISGIIWLIARAISKKYKPLDNLYFIAYVLTILIIIITFFK